jgi:DNA polymerase-3 subunit epsilon
MLTLTRPLCGIDIEATGTEIAKDRIVTLSIVKLTLKGGDERRVWKFYPGFDMTDEVIAIHGITNEEAERWPVFNEHFAREIHDFIKGCDVAGFNSNNYDVPLLWEELFRVDVEWDLNGINLVDAGNIFKKKEERSLSAAVKFYTNEEHTGAHDSTDDVEATLRVLVAQVARYPDLTPMNVPELAKFSAMDDRVDLAGIIVRNKDGHAVFNTKRNKGVRVVDDIGYAEWILRSDFSKNTKRTINRILSEHYDKPPIWSSRAVAPHTQNTLL